MFELFRSEKPALGLVYFRAVPEEREIRERLEAAGIEVRPSDKRRSPEYWALALSHSEQGQGLVALDPNAPPIGEFIQFSRGLTDRERAEARCGVVQALVVVPAERKHVLRDRKRLLWFMRRLLGEDGSVAVDLASGMPWSRASLDDELAHDAELDVEALYVFHAVQESDDRVSWLHTHGLAELGGFDIDVLRPDQWVIRNANDPLRALAFAMLQGKIKPSTDSFPLLLPNGFISLVPAREFMSRASPADRRLREMGPESGDPHEADRSVVCEPRRGGFLRSSKPEPFKLLSSADDNTLIAFDDESTELMAERARGTAGIFRSLVAEFVGWPVTPMVKLGFPASQSGSNEHLWFQVHSVGAETVDCTLVNDPFDVLSLRNGQRANQPLSRLTDWTILSPAGDMTPRSLLAARRLRELPEEARIEIMALAEKQGGKG
jgi:uncharacterized protein YegJ (DUF2314 family)